MQIKVFLSLLLGITWYVAALPATYHVKNSGDDSKNGLSEANAFKTIQKATNLVVAGDSVLVYDGNFTGFNHKNLNSGTALNPIVYMAKGSNAVINQGSSLGDGINIEGNDWIQILGFKVFDIPDNTSIPGGEEGIRAVYANYITIRNCTVDNCFRGIFTGYTDNITIENNTCTNSYGEHGIYVSNNSNHITLRFNSCSYNNATGIQINPDLASGSPGFSFGVICTNNISFENKGAAGFNFQGVDSALIANNLIYNNHNASGITLFHGNASKGCSNVWVYNNTILVPSDGRWGIHVIDDASGITIYNNIIINLHSWKGSIALQPGSFSQSLIISDYNLVTDRFCETSDGCTKTLAQWQSLGYDQNSIIVTDTLDQLFEDWMLENYHPLADCAAIDAGTSMVSTVISDDLESHSRPFGAGYDIGCYEWGSTGINTISDKASVYKALIGEVVHIANAKSDDVITHYTIDGSVVWKGNDVPVRELRSGIYVFSVQSNGSERRIGGGKYIIQ